MCAFLGFLAHQLHLAQVGVGYQASATSVEAGEVFGVLLDIFKGDFDFFPLITKVSSAHGF